MISEEEKHARGLHESQMRLDGFKYKVKLDAVNLYREREEFRVIVDNFPNEFANIVEYIHGRERGKLSEEPADGYSPMITDTARKMMAASKNRWWSGITQSEVIRNLIQLVLWIIVLFFFGLMVRQHG